jgi:hypothetical protein
MGENGSFSIERYGNEGLAPVERFWSNYRAAAGLGELSIEERQQLLHREFCNPFANGEGSCWLALSAGQPVAHLGLISCPAYYEGRRIESGWWCDLFAVADSRNGNAAAALALTVARLGFGHALLGTPGLDSQVAKLYRAMRFDYWGAVPFLYVVTDGARLLRNLFVFKRNLFRTSIANVASQLYFPGKLIALRHCRRPDLVPHIRVEHWRTFPPDADCLWDRLLKKFPFVFNRSTPYLNWRYAEACYTKCGVFVDDQLIGWVVWKLTEMNNNSYFGNLAVGTVVDLLADPDNLKESRTVLRVALEALRQQGAELVVINLSERRLVKAASDVGFIIGPSNYHFFTKNLPTLKLENCHLTRGDSDGDRRL